MVSRVVALIVTMLCIGACGGGTASSPPTPSPSPVLLATVTQTMTDCTLSGIADHAKGPRVKLQIVDRTGVNSAFDMWLVPGGHTYADSVAFIAKERAKALAGQDGLGSDAFFTESAPDMRATLSPNESREAQGYVGAGTYVLVCLREFPTVGLRPSSTAGPLAVT